MLAVEGLRLVHIRLPIDQLVPPDVATVLHDDIATRAAYDEHVLDARGVLDRLVDRGLERHGRATAILPVGRDDELGLRVVDARAQRFGGEPGEDDGVRGADACAREHGHDSLGDHRQVDRHAVPRGDAELGEGVRGLAHLALQLGVGDVARVPGLALEVQGHLVAVP